MFVRLSEEREEIEAGVKIQETDCRALAAQLGWAVGQVYQENDTSAFKRSKVNGVLRVVRPAFRAMIAALDAGSCDAVIAYNIDRVARDMRDLEDLIDVVEARSIPCRAVTGQIDLSNDSGVTMARIGVAIANQSSRDQSRRIKRKHQDMATAGEFAGGGTRPFGYESDGVTVRQSEADIVRRIASDILNGVGLSRIAINLNAEGVPTVRGQQWTGRNVHAVVTKPRNAGQRVYRGKVVGQAKWPAILDADTLHAPSPTKVTTLPSMDSRRRSSKV